MGIQQIWRTQIGIERMYGTGKKFRDDLEDPDRHMKAGVANTKAKTKWHLSNRPLIPTSGTVTGAVHANSMQTQLMGIAKACQPFILRKENMER